MYEAEYHHPNAYWDFETKEELPEEGLLKGHEGQIRFKRINDGFAVYDSTLLNSGFVYPGSPDDVFAPGTINGIPVTELHQSARLVSKFPFAIEGKHLKRVYLDVSKKSLDEQLKDYKNPLGALVMFMLRDQSGENQSEKAVSIEFDFCGGTQQVDYCCITSSHTCILHIPQAKTVEVSSGKIVLRGDVPDCVERLLFHGRTYPYEFDGMTNSEYNNNCFAGKSNLRFLDGSLCGENGWSFRECVSLEEVHLSNGIKQIPPYAFSECRMLKDLYIPDSVVNIGEYAFSNCINLQTIHLPSNLLRISEGMFQNCRSLKKVFLADTIEVIEDHAFEGCTSLRKPWIPKNIKNISESAFPFADWY